MASTRQIDFQSKINGEAYRIQALTRREKTLIQDLGPNPKFGGGERFLQVIREEIAPKVAAIAYVNSRRTALFGWSLGGLFVIKTMFSHLDAFATYLSLSPSLWRSDRAVLTEIADFESHPSISGIRPRLFIAVGSREDEPPSPMFANERMHQQLFAETRYARRVENALDMAHLLQGLYQERHLALMSHVFLGDTHNNVPWSAINSILDFAFLTHDTSAQVH
jgi:predicted alpha/beta superfamily hydrolase